MKAVLLKMQAFGPFAGTEQIRFSDLGDAPLFLINGPTGSGKTTILDAICYALYGTTTGDERQGAQMRCQRSAPSLPTTVSFEFELGGRRYRIERAPDQLRPKQRGDGTTLQRARASLYQLGDDGSEETGKLLVEQKVQDATRYIRDITGLNAEQFRQVMVLPQGQFRKLLVADSKEKQQIFESLFQTTVFKRIEEELKAASAGIRQQKEKGNAMIQGILQSGDVTDEDSLRESIEEQKKPLKRLKKALKTAEETWQQARRDLDEANNLRESFDQLSRTREQEASLKRRATETQGLRLQLAQALAAAGLAPLQDKLRDGLLARERTVAERDAAKSALSNATAKQTAAHSQHAAQLGLDDEREALQKSLHVLDAYQAKSEQLSKAMGELASASEEVTKAQSTHDQACQKRDQQAELLAHSNREAQALQQSVNAASDLDVLLHQLRQAAQQRTERTRLKSEQAHLLKVRQKADNEVTEAAADAERSGLELKRVRQLWHQGQAALLAAELRDGQPCAVCGSTAHPQPAVSAQQLVSEQDIETAQKILDEKLAQLQGAERAAHAAATAQQALGDNLARLETELGAYAAQNEHEFKAALKEQELREVQREKDSARLTTLRQDCKALEASLPGLTQTASSAASTLQQLLQAKTQAETTQGLAAAALPEQYRDPQHLQAELETTAAQLNTLKQSLEKAVQARQMADSAMDIARHSLDNTVQRLSGLEDDIADCAQRFEQALADSPFGTQQECTLAAMDKTERIALEQRIKAYDDELLKVVTTRGTLETQLKGRQLEDIEELQQLETTAAIQRDESQRQWQLSERRMSSLKNTRAKIKAQKLQMATLDEQYAVVGTLADVACGQTGNRVSLQRYVLGVLLDDVLVQASQRLMRMSDGRYQLMRKLEPGGRNRASGLDLEVYDDYSGESRPVTTLSGGESFLAALSLALGLSDVVQAQAGGIQLDTLFVDEGFGTLDSEALELAVATLLDLQKAGRMVGIISHVSELKEQMDVRIDLRMNKAGSALKLVSPSLPVNAPDSV